MRQRNGHQRGYYWDVSTETECETEDFEKDIDSLSKGCVKSFKLSDTGYQSALAKHLSPNIECAKVMIINFSVLSRARSLRHLEALEVAYIHSCTATCFMCTETNCCAVAFATFSTC